MASRRSQRERVGLDDGLHDESGAESLDAGGVCPDGRVECWNAGRPAWTISAIWATACSKASIGSRSALFIVTKAKGVEGESQRCGVEVGALAGDGAGALQGA